MVSIGSQLYSNVDVIVLTETWEICDMNLFKLPNYTSIYNKS